MPRGLSRIKQSKQAADARRAAYDEAGPRQRRLVVKDGETVRVRPLEEGDQVWSVYIHRMPPPAGRSYGDAVMCLDQENAPDANCPACNRAIKREERVVLNVIHYNAPKWKKDKDGKALKDANDDLIYDGVEDAVVTWETSVTNGGRLEHLDTNQQNKVGVGLTGSILAIKREGTNKETKYQIDVDEVLPPNQSDAALFATKVDPRGVIKSLSRGDMERIFSGGGIPSGDSAPSEDSNNAFARAQASPSGRGAFGGVMPPQEPTPTGSGPAPGDNAPEPARSGGVNTSAFG